MEPKPKKAEAEPKTFEDSYKMLETIVRRLEQGTVPLDESLEQYALATKHLQFCYSLLNQAEKKVQLLRGVAADGSVNAVPMDDVGESLAERQAGRAKRRSSRSDLGES